MEQLKFYAKVASASLLRWILLSGSGLLLSVVGIFVGLHLVGNNASAGWATVAGEELWSATQLFDHT